MGKKVSIIIPVYNGSNYVKEAIDSALAQTYKNKEIIVVNDGSTDEGATRDIVKSYGDKVTYYEKENGGVSTALNLGIEKMTGDYFSWLSHDDLYYPNKLEKQMELIEKYDDHTILYSNIDMIDLNGKVFSTVIYDHEMLMAKPDYALLRGDISGISLLIPKSAFDECGGFDTKLRCVQDYLKWFEFLDHYTFIHMTDVLAASRVHPKQVTMTSPKMLTEGNWLWTYMTENYPKKKKEKYEGSEYLFYKEMENYLKSSPYKEAEKNVHDMAEKSLDALKKKVKDITTTVVVIDNGKLEDVNNTIESLLKQKYKPEIIVEGKNKKYKTTKTREESIKNIKTDYYTFINAGVTVKENFLEHQILIALATNKSVIISDYKRPLRTGYSDNLCSYLTPIDGVIFKNKDKAKFETPYQYMYDLAVKGGSFVEEENFLEGVKEEYNMEEVYDYLRRVMNDSKANNHQIASLNYDISVIYNKYNTEGKKVYMYEDSDEFRELKFSRTFRMYYKYYNYKKSKKKTI